MAQDLATIELRHRLPEEVAQIIKPMLEPNEIVIPNRSGLIVKATRERLTEINGLVQELDRKQTRLLITVSQGRGLSLETLNARAAVHASYREGDVRSTGQGHFYQTDSRETGGQTQRVQTLDGQSAQVSFGEQVALPQASYAYAYGGQAMVSQGIQYRETSTGFTVTPRLSGDQVVIDVAPWSERISRLGVGTLETGSVHTQLRINLGQWVEIGGQLESREQNTSGPLAHRYSTRSETQKFFLKVEDLDRQVPYTNAE